MGNSNWPTHQIGGLFQLNGHTHTTGFGIFGDTLDGPRYCLCTSALEAEVPPLKWWDLVSLGCRRTSACPDLRVMSPI
jgi:hypothetical protein